MTDIVDGIAWTPEARALVYPSRKHLNPAFRSMLYESDGLSWPLDVAATRKRCVEEWKGSDWKSKAALQWAKQGLAKNSGHWKPIVEKMIKRCTKPNAAEWVKAPLDVDLEAATVTLELCGLGSAMEHWIAKEGIPFALRALIRTTEITSSWAEHGYGDHGLWIVESRAIGYDRPESNHGAWMILRDALSDALEPIYDEAHGIADAARLASRGLTPNESVLQVMIPFAFPDEAAWAKEGAKSAIALAKQRARASTIHLGLFLSVAPVDKAVELLTCTVNDGIGADDLWTALAHHGAAGGVKILEAALGNAPNAEVRAEWAEVLFAVRTPEAMKAFDRLAKHPKGKKTFADFAKRHREEILVRAAKKPGKSPRKTSNKRRSSRG